MIGFESDEAILQKLRQRLRSITYEELIKFGKMCVDLRRIRFNGSWKKSPYSRRHLLQRLTKPE